MMKHAGKSVALAALAVAATLLSGPLVADNAHRSQRDGAPTLVGTWLVTITTYNCKTLDEGPPFTSILSFAAGGTMTETTSNPGFQPGQRSIGLGTWERSGHRTYWASTHAFILFDSPTPPPPPPFVLQFQRGTQHLEQRITMRGRDAWTSRATNSLIKSNGEEYFSGCARASATRL